jgi:hypothetical protein
MRPYQKNVITLGKRIQERKISPAPSLEKRGSNGRIMLIALK